MAKTTIPREALDENEMKMFKAFWQNYSLRFTNQGIFKFTPDRNMGAAIALCEAFKKTTNRPFQGTNPTSGFGIRRPQPEDVFGTANGDTTGAWDINWATTGVRNWMHNNAPNNAAWQTTSSKIRNVDSTNSTEVWYVGIWGVSDLVQNAGRVTRITADLHGNDQATRYIEYELRANEARISFWEQTLTLLHQPYRTGVDVLTAGVAALFPEGVTIQSSIRAKNFSAAGPARPTT